MIDMSLDEIAQKEGKLKEDLERKGNIRGPPIRNPARRESTAGGPMRRSPHRIKRDTPYIKRSSDRDEKWVHDGFEHLHGNGPRAPRVINTPVNILWGTMVVIDNLKYDVLEDDLKDLMEVIGPVESIKISYDSSGRSLGKAGVVFRSKYDAEQAVKEYHGVEIDGQKMKVEIGSKVKIMVSKDSIPSWRGNSKPLRRSKDERGREDYALKEDRRRDDKLMDKNKDKPNELRKDRPRDTNRERKDDRTRPNNREYSDRSSRDNNRPRDEKPPHRDESQNLPKVQDRENYEVKI
jgi:THO complex subunit 4